MYITDVKARKSFKCGEGKAGGGGGPSNTQAGRRDMRNNKI